jgi:hypothetical protein
MRASWLLVLAGCGRIGFSTGDDVGPDPGDAATLVPDVCDIVDTGAITFAGSPTALRAVYLASGYGVALGTDATNVYAIRLGIDRRILDQHLPLAGGYALRGAGQIQDNLFIYVDAAPESYLKALMPSWDDYTTAQSGGAAAIDPPIAVLPGGATAASAMINATGNLELRVIDPAGLEVSLSTYQPTARAASVSPVADGAVIAVDRGDGTCETARFTGTVSTPQVITGCSDPLVTGDGLLHRSGGGYALRTLGTGTTMAMADVVDPRIATLEGATWLAYQRPTSVDATLVIARPLDGRIVETTIAIKPPFDLSDAGLFWVEDGHLWAGRPCMR